MSVNIKQQRRLRLSLEPLETRALLAADLFATEPHLPAPELNAAEIFTPETFGPEFLSADHLQVSWTGQFRGVDGAMGPFRLVPIGPEPMQAEGEASYDHHHGHGHHHGDAAPHRTPRFHVGPILIQDRAQTATEIGSPVDPSLHQPAYDVHLELQPSRGNGHADPLPNANDEVLVHFGFDQAVLFRLEPLSSDLSSPDFQSGNPVDVVAPEAEGPGAESGLADGVQDTALQEVVTGAGTVGGSVEFSVGSMQAVDWQQALGELSRSEELDLGQSDSTFLQESHEPLSGEQSQAHPYDSIVRDLYAESERVEEIRELKQLLRRFADSPTDATELNTEDNSFEPWSRRQAATEYEAGLDGALARLADSDGADGGMIAMDLVRDLALEERVPAAVSDNPWAANIQLYRALEIGSAEGALAVTESPTKLSAPRIADAGESTWFSQRMRPLWAVTSVALGAILWNRRRQAEDALKDADKPLH